MVAVNMDGRLIAERLKPQVQAYGKALKVEYGLTPQLAVLLVGDDPASAVYVRNKQRLCQELGFGTELFALNNGQITPDYLLGVIRELNDEKRLTGILVQLPLPESINKFHIFDALDPDKDVDALTPTNTLPFYRGEEGPFLPCTPKAVLTLLDFYQIPTQGKTAVVIGRGDIAGKPLAIILGGRLCNASVTWCHRFTDDLEKYTRQADILVSAVGKEVGRPYLITADMVKEGGVVIDISIRRVGGTLVGDVDAAAVKEKASHLTPVPGGVGPMTVMSLMQNLVDATRYRAGLGKAQYLLEPGSHSSRGRLPSPRVVSTFVQ